MNDSSIAFQSLEVIPKNVFLYVPPINWTGDISGHKGINDVFFLVLDGECYLKIENRCYIVRKGQLAFLPQGKMRTYTRISDEFRMYEIGFEAKINGINLFEQLELTENNHVVNLPDFEKTAAYFVNSTKYEMNRNIIFDINWCGNIVNIITDYLTERNKIDNSERCFEKVIEYMTKTPYCDMKLSDLSEISSMHPTYFIKKFKESFGVTPLRYYSMLKIYEAMSILSSGGVQIRDVANRIGITDKTYFSKLFKKCTGMTPVEYRSIFKK